MADAPPLLPGIPLTPLENAPGVLRAAPASGVSDEMRKAAEDFESMVIGQLLQPMFAALSTDGLGGGGFGEEIFRPMLVEEYAKGIAQGGGIGLAQSIITELQRMQQTIEPDAAQTTETAHGAHR